MSLSEGLENKDALKDPSKVILNDDQKISQNNQEPRKEVCKVQAIPQIGQQTSASFTDFKSDYCLSYGTIMSVTEDGYHVGWRVIDSKNESHENDDDRSDLDRQ